MVKLKDFLKDDDEEAEVKEVKEEVIPPVIETPTPIRYEPIIHKDTLTEEEIRAIIDNRISLIFKTRKEQKEQKARVNAEKIFIKLQSLDAEAPENAFYNVIIKSRAQTNRRSFLDSYVHFINKYPDEFIEWYTPEN